MENLTINSKKYLGRKQVVLDCRFNIEPGKEASKVLSVQSKPNVFNSSCEQGRVMYGGKLDTSLVYVTTSGEKVSLVAVSDFAESFDSSEVEPDFICEIQCKIVDITTPSVKANEIKVACIVDVNICYLKQSEAQITCDCLDIITKQTFLTQSKYLCGVSDTFDFVEDIKIEDTLKQILTQQAHICVKDVYCGNGFITMDSDVFICIVYEDENGDIKNYKTKVPLKQELECECTTSECFAKIIVTPLSYLNKTVVTQEDGYNNIKMQLPVQVSGSVYAKEELSVIQDAYSEQDIVQCEKKEFNLISDCASMFFEESCKGVVKVNEADNAEICGFLSTTAEVTNYFLEGNKLNVDGVLSTTVLYKQTQTSEKENGEEQVEVNIVPVITDFGFSFSFDAEKLANTTDLSVYCEVGDIDISLKGDEVEIIAKIYVWAYGLQEGEAQIITNIKPINKREEKTCAMEIFVVDHAQDLWEISKQIGCRQEEVLKLNPHLKNIVNQGERIIIYNKVKANN